jgi:hypothetical protein
MRFLPALFANVVLFLAAVGYGNTLRGLIPERFARIDRAALTLLGGTGLLGTLLFLVGQVWFTRGSIGVVLLAGVALGIRPTFEAFRGLLKNRSVMEAPLLPAMVIGCVLLVTAVGGLAEPIGDIRMDAIAYHFLGPKVWLRDAVIRPVIDECLTSFPAVVETQFAALMSIGGQRAPDLFAFLALLSMLLIAASLALRCGLDARAAWWVAALIATMPVLYRGAYGGFVDVIYSGLVLAATRIGFDAENPREYALFGILCGLAMGTKYNGLIAVTLLFVCIPLIRLVGLPNSRKEIAKDLGIACLVATIVAAPWYIRNWVLMGSPIYPPPPFLLHFFDAKYLPLEAIQKIAKQLVKEGSGMGRGPLSILLLPFHLTYHPANFMNGAGGIGLVPLILAPFGLPAIRKDWFPKALAVFALLQTLAWFATAQEARYMIHVYVIAAIFGVLGWGYVVKNTPRIGAVLAGMVVFVSVSYGLFMIVSARVQDLHAVVSRPYEERRRHEEIPFLESFEYLNGESSVTKVLVLEPRVPVYYFDKNYLRPTGRFGEESIPDGGNVPLLLSELSQLHISHVLDVKPEGKSFRLPDHPAGMFLVYELPDQRIYAVR